MCQEGQSHAPATVKRIRRQAPMDQRFADQMTLVAVVSVALML